MSETEPRSAQDHVPYDGLPLAKLLLRSVDAGALGTVGRPDGHPFASLASVATDHDGSPILLTSNLSAHTLNMRADARVSLLLAQGGKGDPLAHPRLTLSGRAHEELDPARRAKLKARFLARHPKASLYADFGDFSFWRVAVLGAHLNGGFAKAADFPGASVLTDVSDAEGLIAAETGALAHLNEQHADALALIATKLAGTRSARWRAIGLDPEGVDLAAGDFSARIVFPHRVAAASELRRVLVDLTAAARERSADEER